MEHNPDNEIIKKLLYSFQPNIGLDSFTRHAVVDILNITLANEAVLTLKTRRAHWNVRGGDFFDLRMLFDTQYIQLNKISDEIAERVQILGGLAIGSLEDYLTHTRLEEQPGVVPDILQLLSDHEAAIRFLREDAKRCSEEYEDEGSFDLLVSVMRLHEKMAWMLRSHIEPELTGDEIEGSKN